MEKRVYSPGGAVSRESGLYNPQDAKGRKLVRIRVLGFVLAVLLLGCGGGFDTFISRNRSARHRPVEDTFRRGVGFLESVGKDERFFLFLHTYAVHTPYDAPERYREPFWPGDPPSGAVPATGAALTRLDWTGERPPRPVVDWLTALYDAGIRQTDEVLQRFFADLSRLGLADAGRLPRDSRQLRDLSRERTRETRTLLRDLLAFNPAPLAAAGAAPLDPELEESLRALGYLQ